jgi:hypothetical protein
MKADAAVAMRRHAERKGDELLRFLVERSIAAACAIAEKPAIVSGISFLSALRLAEMSRVISI